MEQLSLKMPAMVREEAFFMRERNGNSAVTLTDITTFSFHPVKTMTTGEGGILVTDNDEFASRAKLLRSHGMMRNAVNFKFFRRDARVSVRKPQLSTNSGPWAYEIHELGYNYRITDLQRALGRSQKK